MVAVRLSNLAPRLSNLGLISFHNSELRLFDKHPGARANGSQKEKLVACLETNEVAASALEAIAMDGLSCSAVKAISPGAITLDSLWIVLVRCNTSVVLLLPHLTARSVLALAGERGTDKAAATPQPFTSDDEKTANKKSLDFMIETANVLPRPEVLVEQRCVPTTVHHGLASTEHVIAYMRKKCTESPA